MRYFRYADYKCNDYHLDCLEEENQYFIVAPKDIVVATLYGHDDRVEWLIEHRYGIFLPLIYFLFYLFKIYLLK